MFHASMKMSKCSERELVPYSTKVVRNLEKLQTVKKTIKIDKSRTSKNELLEILK